MHLIHPIYLDVPMLVSFAAAIQGGLSFESEVTREQTANRSGSADITGKLGSSSLFNILLDVTAEADVTGSIDRRNQETYREHKSHTEASIAILLYDDLKKKKEYLIQLQDVSALSAINPGALVEISGVIEKNAIDAVIDYIDAVSILSGMDSKEQSSPSVGTQRASRKQTSRRHESVKQTDLERYRQSLDKDRKRTPISNVILRCDKPSNFSVVVTLRTANLRDLTLTELHKNNVRVIGKITRIVEEGQSMSAFENYGMALIKPEILEEVLRDISATEDVVAEFSEVQVKGPAVQILPLMIVV